MTVSDPADLPALRQRYGCLVALCEQRGVAQARLLPWTVREADFDVRWLEESNVSLYGYPDLPAVQGNRRRPVWVIPKGDGAFLHRDLAGLDGAVEDLLAEPAVVRRAEKVGRADADERHLYVAVDTSGLRSSGAMALVGRPESLPATSTLTLPGRLTHLWLAPRYLHVLLGWTPDGGWRAHDVYDRQAPVPD